MFGIVKKKLIELEKRVWALENPAKYKTGEQFKTLPDGKDVTIVSINIVRGLSGYLREYEVLFENGSKGDYSEYIIGLFDPKEYT